MISSQLIIGASIMHSLFIIYMNRRQYNILSDGSSASNYNRLKHRLAITKAIFTSLFHFYIYRSNILFSLQDSTTLKTIMNICLYSTLEMMIYIPFKIYGTFHIESKYGFNKTSIGTFLNDIFKMAALNSIFIFIMYSCTIKIIESFSNIILPMLLFLLIFQLLLITLAPTLILPLFNKYTDLPKNELYERIGKLAEECRFPLNKIYIMDGSRRSGHSNAFFIGMFKKQIVLYDTLIKQLSDDQIMAVMAHEIAHWYYGHNIQQMAILIFYEFIMIFFMNRFLSRDSKICINIIYLFQFLNDALFPINYLKNFHSRISETMADSFAVKRGYGQNLIEALEILEKENKAPKIIDKQYSTYFYSHPPVQERIADIHRMMKEE